MLTRLRILWSRLNLETTAYRFLPLALPGIGDRLTQTAPCTDPAQYSTAACSGNDLNEGLNRIFDRFGTIFFTLIAGIAIIMVMWAGFQYLTSAGSPDKIKKARTMIIQTLYGLALIIGTYAILRIIIEVATSIANRTP